MAQPLQPVGGQFDRLAAVEDRRDDVGCQEGERQDAADVALVDVMTCREVLDAACLAGFQIAFTS
ncbi:MAG: hypothetical protein GEU87_01330 [Alphaproteobacteria bacterium]|nr:hypothetical protein [Alphaproteobacteria bacterium]